MNIKDTSSPFHVWITNNDSAVEPPGPQQSWVEHIWTRLRRLDYWAPGMIETNASMKKYRPRTPGGQPLPNIPKAGDEKYYDIRYFPNDHRRRDVGYYPDTPLSLTHNIMKNTPLSKNHGLRPDNDAPSQIPNKGAFAALTGGLSYSEELRREGAFDDDGTGQRPIDARDLQGKPMQNF